MTTQNHTIGTTWTETVMDGDDFLLSLPSASRFDVDVATTDTVVAPTVGRGHVIAADLRKSITRALLGPGYVWTKAPKQYTATLSTWSSDLAAILALEGLVGYWPTDPAYLYSDDAGTTLATVGGSVAYRANLISGGPAAVQSTPANQPVLHKYSLSDFYWLETDDGSSTLTATTGDLGASCTVAYADANGAVFTEGVTISSTYSTTPAVGYNSDFMIFNRALTAAEKTLITRHLTRDRDFVQRELLAISGLTGYWKNDPQYMFEDSAGTTPASTGGTGPIGQWRAVGVTPTLTAVTVANSGFDADSDWTKGTGWTIGSGVATKTAGSAASMSQAITLTAGSVYLITWTMTRTAGTLLPRFTGGTTVSGTALSASGTYTENLVAVTGNTTLEFYGDASFAGTVDGVSVVALGGLAAVEATTANKPILRKTPTTGIYWADSNTATSALTATLGNLGSACTVARSGAEGVTFTENVSITSTYNLAPAFGFNSDVALFNRALTATEKALITRYMARAVPMLGSNAVTNGTFDTDTTGWSASASAQLSLSSGYIRVANNGAANQYAQQLIPALSTSKYYFASCLCKGDGGTGKGRLMIGSSGKQRDGAVSSSPQVLQLVGAPNAGAIYLFCLSATTTGVYTEFDNVTAQEIL